jgi:MYXO-CTERM domain-containing protein
LPTCDSAHKNEPESDHRTRTAGAKQQFKRNETKGKQMRGAYHGDLLVVGVLLLVLLPEGIPAETAQKPVRNNATESKANRERGSGSGWGCSHEDEEGARGTLGLVGVLLGLALLHREPATPTETDRNQNPGREISTQI